MYYFILWYLIYIFRYIELIQLRRAAYNPISLNICEIIRRGVGHVIIEIRKDSVIIG